MFDKLEEVEKRYEDLSSKLISPEVISDGKLYSKYAKEHAEIAEVRKFDTCEISKHTLSIGNA